MTPASGSRWMLGASSRPTRGTREGTDGAVLEELPAGDRAADPAGAATGEDVAGLALRADPPLRRDQLGPGALRSGRGPGHALVPAAPGPPERHGRCRHALRDRLDDPRQYLDRSVLPDVEGAGEAVAGRELGDRTLRGRLHLELVARGDGRRRCARGLGEPRGGPHARARLALAARGPEAVCVEEREVADRARVRGQERARVLGGPRLPRARGAVRGGAVLLSGRSSGRAGAVARAPRILAARTEIRRPSADDGPGQVRAAARASASGMAGTHPPGVEPARISVHGAPDDPTQRSEQRVSLVVRESVDRPARMDPGPPQDLVGEEVADARHEPLVHQRGLDPAAASIEEPEEPGPAQPEGVGAQVSEERIDLRG